MPMHLLRSTRSLLTVVLLLLPVSTLQAAVALPGGPLPAGLAGASYYTILTTIGGLAPFTWTLGGNLPAGLSLDPSAGVIYGIPPNPGPSTFTLSVTDANGSTTQSSYQLTINPAPTGTQTRVGVCPHIAFSGGWHSTVTVTNLDPTPVLVWVNLWKDTGGALSTQMVFPQEGGGPDVTSNFVSRTLPAGGSLIVNLDGNSETPTVEGWAEIASTGHVGAFAIFRLVVTGRADAEGTASLDSHTQTKLLIPFDNTIGYTTSLALVNNSINQQGAVTVTILDENGTTITPSQALQPLSGNGHTAFAVNSKFPQTQGRRGVLVFQTTSGTNLTGLAFRFNPTDNFTSVPVMYPPVSD